MRIQVELPTTVEQQRKIENSAVINVTINYEFVHCALMIAPISDIFNIPSICPVNTSILQF